MPADVDLVRLGARVVTDRIMAMVCDGDEEGEGLYTRFMMKWGYT